MMKIEKINTSHRHYPFVESLLMSAFPLVERRDTDMQRLFTDSNSLFHCHVITMKGKPVGLINSWDMGHFVYVEHFAISSDYRNKGYGAMAMETFIRHASLPIVIEVEKPEDDISQRRIGFYQRLGFVLHTYPYVQPPYRLSDSPFEMLIMSHGAIQMETQFPSVRQKIYHEVYQFDLSVY